MGRLVAGWRDWTAPVGLGGGGFSGSGGSNIAAAHGVLAATFLGATADACKFFVLILGSLRRGSLRPRRTLVYTGPVTR